MTANDLSKKFLIHYHNFDVFTATCKQDSKHGLYMTNKKSNVTCKKCLKIINKKIIKNFSFCKNNC